MKNRKREIRTSGSVRDEDGQHPHLLGRHKFLHLARHKPAPEVGAAIFCAFGSGSSAAVRGKRSQRNRRPDNRAKWARVRLRIFCSDTLGILRDCVRAIS